MGNTKDRVITGLDSIVGALAGPQMLEKLKATIIKEPVYQKMFGNKGERIFLNEDAAVNETILPLWEFQWDTETVMGADLYQTGFINSRILFPNNLSGKYDFYRLVAISISRFFNSQFFTNDFLKQVSGLNEFAEDLNFAYNQTYKRGEMSVPALVMRIPFKFDLRRLRLIEDCTDFDAQLSALLLEQIASYSLEIKDDDNNVLIPADVPLVSNP